jgi:hypothetical protein
MRSTHYVETDLGRAALLNARGYPFVGLRDLGDGRFGFEFQDEQGTAARDAASYYSATVQAHELVERLRILKRALALNRENPKHDHAHRPFAPTER